MGRYICAISEDPDDMISASCDALLKVCNVYRLFNNITATRVATCGSVGLNTFSHDENH